MIVAECFFSLPDLFRPDPSTMIFRGIMVAVGMPATRHRARRSQHALLTHWTPTSGNDAKARKWMRMTDAVQKCENHPIYVQQFLFHLQDEKVMNREILNKVESQILE
jgi:hypothetical protein